MCQYVLYIVIFGEFQEFANIFRVDGLRASAPRIPGEELEGVGADGQCGPAHIQISFRYGEMAAYSEHTHLMKVDP